MSGGDRAGHARRTPARGAAKIPRFDYGKYLHGGAAGRRELVHGFGDALREQGCARLQGHGEVRDAAAATAVAAALLAALEDYFGLPAAALQGLMAGGAERVEEAAGAVVEETATGEGPARAPRSLLQLVPEVPAGTEVRIGSGAWSSVAANAGELLAVPGAALSRLTAGVVPAVALRLPAGAASWCACAPAGAALSPRPEFCG